MQNLITPILDSQREFRIEELFFSTTNSAGIILHGNDVFARISGYTEDELLGSPHSIIRHPDMPRAVFQLLWETIQDGKTIAAYVKNLAKDGSFYWVLAVVMPCDVGYLSIRLKPTSPLFHAAEKIYERLIQVEKAIEIEPKRRPFAMEASRRELATLLQDSGFASYEHFMRHALSSEMALRDSILQQEPKRSSGIFRGHRLFEVDQHCRGLDEQLKQAYDRLEEFQAINVSLVEKSDNILEMAEAIRTLSLNATIAASKLGNRGATLQVVSESLGSVSENSQGVTSELAVRMKEVTFVLDRLIFDLAATKLQSEVSLHFVEELSKYDDDHPKSEAQESLSILIAEMDRRTRAVFKHLEEAEKRMAELQTQILRLARNNKTLRFVQFAGEKESVAWSETKDFVQIFHEVRSQIDHTKKECDFLGTSLHEVLAEVKDLQNYRSFVEPHLVFLEAFRANDPVFASQ